MRGGPGDDVAIDVYAAESVMGRSDVVIAGPGNDSIFFDGEPGGNPVNCGPGNDTVFGVALPRTLISCENVNP